MKILLFSVFTLMATLSNSSTISTPINNNEDSCTASTSGSKGSVSCTASNCTAAVNCAKAGYKALQ